MAKNKIDDNILLDLAAKGASVQEIAKYFDVHTNSVRSKVLTLGPKHPHLYSLQPRAHSKAQLPIAGRVSTHLNRYLDQVHSNQRECAKIDLTPDLDQLEKHMSLVLKGLTVLEKIHKITAPTQSQTTVNVASVTNILDTTSQSRTVIDHNHVDNQ